MPRYFKPLRPVARKYRKAPTTAERLLWQRLRKNQIQNTRFYRQRPVGRFIADFLSVDPPLVIEVDGEYHCEDNQLDKDHQRDQILKAKGYHILRFSNNQVITQTLFVIEAIRSTIKELLKPKLQ